MFPCADEELQSRQKPVTNELDDIMNLMYTFTTTILSATNLLCRKEIERKIVNIGW